MTGDRRIPLAPAACAPAPYDVVVGDGILPSLGRETARIVRPGVCAVVTDANVAQTPHPDAAAASLAAAGFRPFRVVLPPGESAKALGALSSSWDAFAAAGLDRSGVVVAVGGGATGDAAGLAAALWMRGVPVVHVPTTLLAMADSAVGGKTAIDHAAGKNLVGVVHQPALVLADVATLGTLPHREFVSGFAEIVKCAVLADRSRIAGIATASGALLAKDPDALADAIAFAAGTKSAHVRDDPFDTRGVRALLNLGHTTAHALEAAAGYGTILHGEAVAVGLVVAARIAARRGLCEAPLVEDVTRALACLGLPVAAPPGIPAERLVAWSRLDKKNVAGRRRMVLPETGTGAVVVPVPDDEFAAAFG